MQHQVSQGFLRVLIPGVNWVPSPRQPTLSPVGVNKRRYLRIYSASRGARCLLSFLLYWMFLSLGGPLVFQSNSNTDTITHSPSSPNFPPCATMFLPRCVFLFFSLLGFACLFSFSFFFFLSHLCFLPQTDTQTYCFQFTEGSSPEENLGVEQTQQQGPPSIKHGTSNTMMTSEREINTVWMSERAQRRTNKWWIQWLRLSAPAALSSGLPPL